MSDFQGLCKKLHPVIKSIGEGADFMVSSDGITWVDVDKALSALSFLGSCEFKEKPRTIKIGDFDVPEPMRADIGIGNKYFAPSLASASAIGCTWLGDGRDYELLRNGLCHETSEAAEVHAKALIALTSAK